MKVMHNSSRKKGYIDIHCHMLPGVDDGSASRAAAYVGIADRNTGKAAYACSINTDIMTASIEALIGAINKLYFKK